MCSKHGVVGAVSGCKGYMKKMIVGIDKQRHTTCDLNASLLEMDKDGKELGATDILCSSHLTAFCSRRAARLNVPMPATKSIAAVSAPRIRQALAEPRPPPTAEDKKKARVDSKATQEKIDAAVGTAKVNGEQIFVALLTVTNEKGEIRVCNLVATKSHSQFELALTRMRESLEQYGHDQPAIFYTDNMGDKEFLERCFPSLREAVISVEKYSHLPALEIPTSFDPPRTIDCTDMIDDAMRSILQDVSDDGPLDNTPVYAI
ncbi:hypothetical protein B0H13DRAFT_2379853 [Mycena leptocephala]|nr:hypothetical protein B0H13DRAFT_2379853 [Mycena leptocephala]